MTFEPLEGDWLAYRDRGLAIGCRLFNRETPAGPAQLDDLYAWCLAQDWPTDRLDERPQVLALAMGLGHLLATEHGFAWGVARDGDLHDIALRDDRTGAVVWIVAMITRRLTARQETTMAAIIAGIDTALKDVAP